MPILNGIETVLENFPAPNQELGPNNIECLNVSYLNHFTPILFLSIETRPYFAKPRTVKSTLS